MLVSSYDTELGGFGKAPKFPQPGMFITFILNITLNIFKVGWTRGKNGRGRIDEESDCAQRGG